MTNGKDSQADEKPGVGRIHTIEPTDIRSQVTAAFARAGHGWGFSTLAAIELEEVFSIGDRCAEADQWADAQIVYATIADEILPSYEELEEEDQIANVLGECMGGLLACLEIQGELQPDDQLEDADRQSLLQSLFALWKHGCEYGPEDEVDRIPEVLAQQVTADERMRIEQWVQQEKSSDTWLSRPLNEFLEILSNK